MRVWPLYILVLPSFLGGCANLNSIHHTFKAGGDNPDSIAIDAKQRVVIATTKRTPEYDKDGKLTRETIIARACAEPSPDAIAALASSLAGSGDLTSDKIQAALRLQGSLTQTETASFVGIRTQTIQLLRDGMYRLCEAYISDALDANKYNRLQRRYQNLMMGLLSIEQLTGAIVAPQIAIAGGAAQSRQGASELVRSQMAQGYSEAKAKAKEKQEALDAAKAQSVSATGNVNGIKSSQPVDSEKLRQAEATQAAAEAAFKSAQKERDLADAKEAVYKEGFEKSLSGLDTMVAGGSAQTLQSYQARLGNDFAKMADTVREIVETVVNKALVADECFLAVTEVASLAAARTAPNASEIVPLITAEMDKCNRLGLEQALNKLKVDALSTSAEQQKNEIDSLRKKLAAGEADAKKVKELEDKLDKAKNEFKSITSDIQRAANEASNAAKQSKADVLPESGRAVPSPQK